RSSGGEGRRISSEDERRRAASHFQRVAEEERQRRRGAAHLQRFAEEKRRRGYSLYFVLRGKNHPNMDKISGIFSCKDEAFVIHLYWGIGLDVVVSDVCNRWKLCIDKVEFRCVVPDFTSSKMRITNGEDIDRMVDMHINLGAKPNFPGLRWQSPQPKTALLFLNIYPMAPGSVVAAADCYCFRLLGPPAHLWPSGRKRFEVDYRVLEVLKEWPSESQMYNVLVLEIVMGKRSRAFSDSTSSIAILTLWYAVGLTKNYLFQMPILQVWDHWTNGTVQDIVDPSLGGQYLGDKVRRCIHIGLLCVQEAPEDRPTMTSVVLMLSSYSVSLQAPSRAAYVAGHSQPAGRLVGA
ncbi:hypothetical protein Taro_043450, partial [Colocasia esculenta]|nr:hypothetical protein [Colocasia esculenta]